MPWLPRLLDRLEHRQVGPDQLHGFAGIERAWGRVRDRSVMHAYTAMSHRTQIVLTDDQYARLKRESGRTGVTLGELIRRAVDSTYGDVADPNAASILDATSVIDATSGAWSNRDRDGEAYVEGIRKGLAGRLGR